MEDYDPSPTADGSHIIFASTGRNGPHDATMHLYIASRRAGAWSVRPLDNGDAAYDDYGPQFSPDEKTLYYVSDRGGASNVWSITVPPTL